MLTKENPLVYIYQKNYPVSIRYSFVVKVVKAGKVVLPHPTKPSQPQQMLRQHI